MHIDGAPLRAASLRPADSFFGIVLGRRRSPSLRLPVVLFPPPQSRALIGGAGNKPLGETRRGGGLDVFSRVMKAKRKDNVWSIDNEEAAKAAASDKRRMRSRRKKGGRRANDTGRRSRAGVLVSESMLVEIDTVLQTQEPVIIPSWETFTSSLSGIWKGVGAVFSPLTAEMEPIGIGKKGENLYDCYTLSQIEKMNPVGQIYKVYRKINWVAFNSFGEIRSSTHARDGNQERDSVFLQKNKIDLGKSDILDEDCLSMEPGLVFFEDGSYSCGPFEIPVGQFDESKYFLSPTIKFEQCLVKGCHKRLRIVHTIEFAEGGASIQIIRVAVYEEQWDQPVSIAATSSVEFDLKPFSQRRRTQSAELSGSWKVFEVSATPIPPETYRQDAGPSHVYLCTETLKRRSLPENQYSFGEEEMQDMQGVTVLWLPGGVTAYVDVNDDGVLCIGVGWYSDEGINLVMERDYGTDGKLKEVRWKSEVKRRWNDVSTS